MTTRKGHPRRASSTPNRTTTEAVTLADVAIIDKGGKRFTGGEVARLLEVASRHPGLDAADDVNMALRGLGVLCTYATDASGSDPDQEFMFWFLGRTLSSLAAVLEVGDKGDAAAYAVEVAQPSTAEVA